VALERRHRTTRLLRCEVAAVARTTPLTRRVTLRLPSGDGTDSVDLSLPDDHLRILLPDARGRLHLPQPRGERLHWVRPVPVRREYTVRRWRPDVGEVDLDVIDHGHRGPGLAWAEAVRPGDEVWAVGPRPSLRVPDAMASRLLVADHVGLPAVARFLEEQPLGARSCAAVVIPDGEQVDVAVPPGSSLRWLPVGSGDPTQQLVDFLESAPAPVAGTFLFCARGSRTATAVRAWADARGVPRTARTVATYWQDTGEGRRSWLPLPWRSPT
jgi:NADPH-dependent ferric siderophore reductase